MTIVDLNGPTGLLLQWGWLLFTHANGLMYLLIVVVFVLGVFVRLPGNRRKAPRRDDAQGGTP